MHELKIIQDIFPLLERVAKEHRLKSINRVVLGVGMLRQVQSEFLQFAFTAMAAESSLAQGAELMVKPIPITLFCQDCQQQFAVQENVYACPTCSGIALEFLTGKEVILESVEGERED